MSENPESAQEALIQMHIQRAVAPARQFREGADEAEKALNFKAARALQQQAMAVYDQAENAQELAVEIEEAYKAHGIERLPLEDFLKSVLTDPERPLLASLFNNPLIQEAIRTQVPRDLIHQIFDRQILDSGSITRPGKEKPEDRIEVGRRGRGERAIMVGRIAFSTDENGPQTYDQVVIAANPAVFQGLSETEIAAYNMNTVRNNTGQVLDIIEKQIPGATGTKGIPRVLYDYYEEFRQDPFFGSMTPRERQIYFFRQSGDDINPGEKDWRQMLADYKASQQAEKDSNAVETKSPAGCGADDSRREEKLPVLIDLESREKRAALLGLSYVMGQGLRDSDRTRLISLVYGQRINAKLGNLKANQREKARKEALEGLSGEYDSMVEDIYMKIKIGRQHEEKGTLGRQIFLMEVFREIDSNPVLSLLTPEELRDVLARRLPEDEMEAIASSRRPERIKGNKATSENPLAQIEVGPVTSTQYLREIAGEGDQRPPSE